MASRPLRIGTRGSPMALRQTAIVRDRLIVAHPELGEGGAVEVVTIRTTGDRVQDRVLAEIGGKGLFAKEIEEALIAGLAEAVDGQLMIEGLLLKPDGSGQVRGRREGGIAEAEAIGTELGRELRCRAGPSFGLN